MSKTSLIHSAVSAPFIHKSNKIQTFRRFFANKVVQSPKLWSTDAAWEVPWNDTILLGYLLWLQLCPW